MRILTRLLLLTVLAISTLGAGMCGSDELKTGAKTAHRSFVVLRGLRDTNASLHDHGKLTDAEFRTNIGYLQTASAAGGELITAVDTALTEIERLEAAVAAHPDDKDAQERLASAKAFARDNIRPKLRAFATTVRNLNEQGILRIANPDARAQLSDLLSFVLTLL